MTKEQLKYESESKLKYFLTRIKYKIELKLKIK